MNRGWFGNLSFVLRTMSKQVRPGFTISISAPSSTSLIFNGQPIESRRKFVVGHVAYGMRWNSRQHAWRDWSFLVGFGKTFDRPFWERNRLHVWKVRKRRTRTWWRRRGRHRCLQGLPHEVQPSYMPLSHLTLPMGPLPGLLPDARERKNKLFKEFLVLWVYGGGLFRTSFGIGDGLPS